MSETLADRRPGGNESVSQNEQNKHIRRTGTKDGPPVQDAPLAFIVTSCLRTKKRSLWPGVFEDRDK